MSAYVPPGDLLVDTYIKWGMPMTYIEDRKDGGRFVFECLSHEIQPVIEWCLENFGARHRKRWGSSKSGSIYISDKELAMAFKLRWL